MEMISETTDFAHSQHEHRQRKRDHQHQDDEQGHVHRATPMVRGGNSTILI